MPTPLLCPTGGLLPNEISLADSAVGCGGGLGRFAGGMVPKAARTGDEMRFGVTEGGVVEACS